MRSMSIPMDFGWTATVEVALSAGSEVDVTLHLGPGTTNTDGLFVLTPTGVRRIFRDPWGTLAITEPNAEPVLLAETDPVRLIVGETATLSNVSGGAIELVPLQILDPGRADLSQHNEYKLFEGTLAAAYRRHYLAVHPLQPPEPHTELDLSR